MEKADEFLQFAQKALIIKNNKILLIKKSSKDKIQPLKYDLPGGRKKVDETLEEHIKREVKEEVGLDIVPGKLFDMWQFFIPQGDKKITGIAVARFCEIVNGDIKITEDEISSYEWFNIDKKLLELNYVSGMFKTIEKLVNFYSKN